MDSVVALVPSRLPTAEMIADALASEGNLIDELVLIMRRQRSAVAIDDLQAVDDTVFATHRVLATLGEARKRRRTLNTMLGAREDTPIDALDGLLGSRMTESLRAVRKALQQSAKMLSQEVAVNRHVLRSALANGDIYLRTLAGAPAPSTYTPQCTAPDGIRGGALINLRA